ncbi:hypothetical protein VrSk94_24090 [Vibrio rotiferianus]
MSRKIQNKTCLGCFILISYENTKSCEENLKAKCCKWSAAILARSTENDLTVAKPFAIYG